MMGANYHPRLGALGDADRIRAGLDGKIDEKRADGHRHVQEAAESTSVQTTLTRTLTTENACMSTRRTGLA